MAVNIEYYESQIRGKHYTSLGSAKAAVTRAGMTPKQTDRLHAIAEEVYGGAKQLLENGNGAPGPTHVEQDSLHKIALRVTLYAMDRGVPVNTVLEQIHSIIRNA